MRNVLCFFLLFFAGCCGAQSADMPTPSDGVPAAAENSESVSILDNSGALVAELSLAQNLAVSSKGAKAQFETALSILGERVSVFDKSGKLVLQRLVGSENTIDLSELQKGIYEIRFDSKKWTSFKISKTQ